MDLLLRKVSEIRESAKFKGNDAAFRSSTKLVEYCRKLGVIADVKDPSDIAKSARDDYFDHLSALTKKHLFANPEQKSWARFVADPGNRKVNKILKEFGIRGALFSDDDQAVYNPIQSSSKNITIEELYELCQIQFNFEGSLGSFKRYLQRTYGSFAEYCIAKGYDINTCKWESEETAMRVAERIGSTEEIKKRSTSLYNFLESKNLLKQLSAG